MTRKDIVCSMCGYSFNPTGHERCQSCPVSKGCTLVCCPNCGFETVNPENSTLVKLASSMLSLVKLAKRSHQEKEI